MPSRRHFLSSSAALAVFGLGKRPSFTRSPEELEAPQQNPTPPSIAALKSMKDQVRPITNDERHQRIENARRLMTEQKIDALFLAGGTSLKYFTNVDWGNSERMFAVVIPRTGRSFVVCPYFERDRAMEQINSGPLAKDTDIMTWSCFNRNKITDS